MVKNINKENILSSFAQSQDPWHSEDARFDDKYQVVSYNQPFEDNIM